MFIIYNTITAALFILSKRIKLVKQTKGEVHKYDFKIHNE